jgi:hypothetical protein
LKLPAGVMCRPWRVPDEVFTSQAAGVYISNYISLIFVFSLKLSSFFKENNIPSAMKPTSLELVLRTMKKLDTF